MFQKVISGAVSGIQAIPVETEIDLTSGMPYFTIVGLSESPARGVRERIRSALASTGCPLPPRRITVNLSAADAFLHPEDLDLAIAVGILAAGRFLPDRFSSTHMVSGALSLSGELKPVHCAMHLALLCRRLGLTHLLISAASAEEAALVPGINVIAVHSLKDVMLYLTGQLCLTQTPPHSLSYRAPSLDSLRVIRGQLPGKRALAIACAGFHNLLFGGPPGCGKTLLVRSMPSLLPPPDERERMELLQIASLFQSDSGAIFCSRPIRSPHHSVSTHALLGGGNPPRPGELTRAHGGILFLDEMAEFSRTVLENLRQPLESHEVCLHYLDSVKRFPADFLLAGTMNLCPCGHYPDPERCTCRPNAIRRYQARISAPLLERIDLCLTLDPVPFEDNEVLSEAEAKRLRDDVAEADARQKKRFAGEPFSHNSRMDPAAIKRFCGLSAECESVLSEAAKRLGLSLRTQHNTLKTARSIADLAGREDIIAGDLLEALQYRPRGFADS